MADKTIVNYDQIANIGKSFEQEGETIANLEMKLRQKAQDLESEWIGEGADKFFNEFFQVVLPGIVRLSRACVMTAHTIRVVSEIFNEAEEETAGYFKDGALEGGIQVEPGEAPGGITPSDLGGVGGPRLETSPGGVEMPPTGDGPGLEHDKWTPEVGIKEESGVKPVPANQEQSADKWMSEQEPAPTQADTSMGGGGGGGSSSGSQGMQGGLEMGVGSHSQVSGGPGAAPSGVGGEAGMQDHVYQSAGGVAGPSVGASPQSAASAGGVAGSGAAPAQQGGVGDAARAAGALGGAGAAASAGATAAKKLKENKDGQ